MSSSEKNTVVGRYPIIFFHGDKGGVGKSWACSAFTDWLVKKNLPVALIDGDTRNPDVSRMFGDSIQVCHANLRIHDGWMDTIDFIMGNSEKIIVISMPAGIGGEFKKEASPFCKSIEWLKRPLIMFWVINRLPDSINLLGEAMDVIGNHLDSKFVVKNLFFGESEKFTRWDNSETKKRFEKSGGKTLSLTELQERAVDKLFSDNDNIIPFSSAAVPISDAHRSPHQLTPSENLELLCWLDDNHQTFSSIQASLGI